MTVRSSWAETAEQSHALSSPAREIQLGKRIAKQLALLGFAPALLRSSAARTRETLELVRPCGLPKFGARPRNQRFAGRTLILAPHTHLRARPRRPRRPRARRSARRRQCGKRSLIPPCPQAVAASDGITRIRESADAEFVLGEREAGAQGRVGDNEVTTSEASLSAPSTRLGRESHRYGNEVAAPTNGSPLSSGKSPAGRRGNQRRFLESRLRSPAQCTSLRHRE
jgi:hypothetical protein